MKNLTQNYSWHLIFIFSVRNNYFFIWWSFKIEFFLSNLTLLNSLALICVCVIILSVHQKQNECQDSKQQQKRGRRKKTQKFFQVLSLLFIQSQCSWQQAGTGIHVKRETIFLPLVGSIENAILRSPQLSNSFEVDLDHARCSLWELSRI